ncbi:hypothetical protein SDRG_13051 [Saprolegnia diclina VS20]|uniref:BZIP domain-containing protein n=1 Tax=Saprolegnia diclina (strain VS20) TaxID=1156394 RepID=T0RAH2_SAPDV|nr:hypothetical protein SDRG_13051 [Saprolegnia diclina VS20]EQC29178.1 hypothetical protein SDRG_13051 [Saprolegnia diclina VS20]|eukprot:XP_008617356.1 hypothetical protein SDRG_13051 [Saprolegnia diclina VS20]
MASVPSSPFSLADMASCGYSSDEMVDMDMGQVDAAAAGCDFDVDLEWLASVSEPPPIPIVVPDAASRFEYVTDDNASMSSAVSSPASKHATSTKSAKAASTDAYDKKKQYNRERNRRFRMMEKQEATQLSQQIQDLQSQLKQIESKKRATTPRPVDDDTTSSAVVPSKNLLPWKDVATIFKTMKDASSEKQSSLHSKVRKYKEIACIMNSWVAKSMSVPTFSDPFKQSWRNSSLMAHESSRRLGFDWITKQLYHNIDAMIQHCGLPSTMAPCSEVHVFPLENDPSYHLVKARQRIEYATLDEVTQTLQRLYFQKPDGLLDMPDPNIMYFRMKSPYGATQQNSYFQNILARQFFDENRYVVFTHSITDDEKYPLDRIQRNWTNWTIAERLGHDRVIIKQVSVANGLRMKDQYLPFDQDPSTALSTDPVVQFRQFEHKTHVYHQRIFAQDVLKFQQTLAQIRYENATARIDSMSPEPSPMGSPVAAQR